MPDLPPIPPLPLQHHAVAQAAVAKDFLGKVPGLHGVALGFVGDAPAVYLTANTNRPPESHRIPSRLLITIDGVKYAVPLAWLKTKPHAPGALVPTIAEVIAHAD